jgi:hypothetical protein
MTTPRRIYACYSDSHRPLLEKHFLPSVPSGFDLVLRRVPQECSSGVYLNEGWGRAMAAKTMMILDALKIEKQTFVVSDVDVRFYSFKPEDVRTFDIECYADVLFQNDEGMSCPGFMLVHPGQLTEQLFRLVLDNIPRYNSEQAALNYHALPEMKANTSIRCDLLPKDRFWTKGNSNKITPPPTLAVHHANWCSGIANKLLLLSNVRTMYESLT